MSKWSVFSVLIFAACLSGQSTQKTNEAYVQDLKSGDPALQREACKQLGLRRADNTVEAITALLTSSTDVDVQVSAAAALGEIAEVRSTSPLLKVLNTNPSPRLQYASLAALGGIARINGTGKHKAAVIEAATRVKSGSTDSLLQDLADKIIQMYQK